MPVTSGHKTERNARALRPALILKNHNCVGFYVQYSTLPGLPKTSFLFFLDKWAQITLFRVDRPTDLFPFSFAQMGPYHPVQGPSGSARSFLSVFVENEGDRHDVIFVVMPLTDDVESRINVAPFPLFFGT